MPTPRQIPDDLWAEIEPLLPPPPSRERGGRTRASDRMLLDAMLYILWTGAPWRAMPPEFGAWQTVYDRFAEWKRAGVFEQIWARCLYLYDGSAGLSGSGKVVTGHMSARLRGEKNAAPTRRIGLNQESKTTFCATGAAFPFGWW